MKFVVPVVEGVDLEGLLNVYGKDAVAGIFFDESAEEREEPFDTEDYIKPWRIHGEFKTIEKREILDVVCTLNLPEGYPAVQGNPHHIYIFGQDGKILGHLHLPEALDLTDPEAAAIFGEKTPSEGFTYVHHEGDNDFFEVTFLITVDGTSAAE